MNKKKKQIKESLMTLQAMVGFFKEGKTHSDIINANEMDVDIPEDKKDSKELIPILNKLNAPSTNQEKGSRAYYGLSEIIFFPEVDEIQNNEKAVLRPISLNIEKALFVFEERICHLDQQLKSVTENLEIVEKNIKKELEARKNLKQELEKNFEEINTKKEEVENKLHIQDEILRALEGEQVSQEDDEVKIIAKTISEREEAIQESKKLDDELKIKIKKFKDKKNEKQDEIRFLQSQKYGSEVDDKTQIDKKRKSKQVFFDILKEKEDGKVVFSEPRSRSIYIDLGESPKIIKGLKFDVYRIVEGGARVFKGRIEVQQIMEKISRTIILEQNDLDPIVRGDILLNPIFDKEKNIHFTFAGKPKKLTKEMIEEVAVVEDFVSAKTNFVIIGAQDSLPEKSSNYASAMEFGIPFIMEKDVLQYVGD
jgi:hypothetical protein